jgi:Uncharacterized protein conserved in bacteria (DUF2252)
VTRHHAIRMIFARSASPSQHGATVRRLLERCRYADVARKVAGVGSVGTRCWGHAAVGTGISLDIAAMKRCDMAVCGPNCTRGHTPRSCRVARFSGREEQEEEDPAQPGDHASRNLRDRQDGLRATDTHDQTARGANVAARGRTRGSRRRHASRPHPATGAGVPSGRPEPSRPIGVRLRGPRRQPCRPPLTWDQPLRQAPRPAASPLGELSDRRHTTFRRSRPRRRASARPGIGLVTNLRVRRGVLASARCSHQPATRRNRRTCCHRCDTARIRRRWRRISVLERRDRVGSGLIGGKAGSSRRCS